MSSNNKASVIPLVEMCSIVFKSLLNKSKYVILCKVKLLNQKDNLKCNYSDAIR